MLVFRLIDLFFNIQGDFCHYMFLLKNINVEKFLQIKEFIVLLTF